MKEKLLLFALVLGFYARAADVGLTVDKDTSELPPARTNFFEVNKALVNAVLDRKSGEVVPTLASLLALDVADIADGTLVGVAGRSAAGDWGDTRFARWVLGSSATTNKAFVFSGTGGRWIFEDRKSPEIDARWFGVTPNALVSRSDTSGSGSGAYLQDAYDYAFANNVPTIRLPHGYIGIETTVYPKPGIRLKGQGGYYTQSYETNLTITGGGTVLYPMAGLTVPIIHVRGSDAASISSQQTVFTSGDLSYNTNYNFGGAIEGVAIDSGYIGLRGFDIVIDSCFGFVLEDVAFYPYGGRWPLMVWASNVIELRRLKGLTQNPICLFYSADCIVTEASIGGGVGPKLWLKGSKNIITDSQFFNTQAQSTPVRQTFTANASTDTITIGDGAGGIKWFDGMPVSIEAASGATLPGGLFTNQVFYIVRTAGSDTVFKLNSRRTYNSSGTGGALQGVGMDISSAGSGTFTIGPGPVANMLVDEYDQNQIIGVRLDQSAGDAIQFWGASENTIIGASFTESGWNAASDQFSAVRVMGNSMNNRFIGGLIRNRSSTSHAGYGLTADAGSTNNFWYGQLTGVTNMFGANPNTWFAQRWDPSNQRMEVYSSGWRGIGTMPNGVAGVSYDLPGILKMTAPSNTVPAARFLSTESQETIQLFSHTDVDGKGASISTYSRGGTEASPTQYPAQRELFEVVNSAYNGSGDTFSIASFGTRTAGPVTTSSAPTRFFVSTTDSNSVSRAVRMQIYENGAIDVGNNGISFTAANPTGTALRVVSTNGTFLVPVMTSTQRDAISGPPTYGLIANSTTAQLEWYNGSTWSAVGSGGGSYTTENAQDDVMGNVIGTNNIATTYDDVAGKLIVGLSNTVSVTQLDTTTLNAGTMNIVTNRAGDVVATNGISLAGTRITSWAGFQASNANLDDLADGSLTGSKVGSGIDAGNITAGTLAVARGGSGAGTFTANGLLYGNGTSAFGVLAPSASKLVFYNGSSVPVTRALGTGLSDDGTSINATGGGGGSVFVDGSTVSNPNFKSNWRTKLFAESTTNVVGYPALQVSSSGSSFTPDLSASMTFAWTLTGTTTINAPSNVTTNHIGQIINIEVLQDGTGGRSATWATNYAGGGDITTPLSLSTSANYADHVAVKVIRTNYFEFVGLSRGFAR